MGRSAANLAYDNMRHADETGLPVWGWSSCADPEGGYIGWGKLRDEVVTPHASVLAVEDFPAEVVANLYALQRLGARPAWEENGQTYAFGFRDSVSLTTKHVADGYLVLDQGMLFLSLANFLENGLVRRYFHADPRVQSAVQKIGELAKPEGGPNVSVYEPGLGNLIAPPQVSRHLDVPRMPLPPVLDGDLSDWAKSGRDTIRFPDHGETGVPPTRDRFEGAFQFAWDADYLYVGADVKDDDLVCEVPATDIYRDDAIELFLDPKNDGFIWGNPADFQIGFSPSGPAGQPQMYSWFQNVVPQGAEVSSQVRPSPDGASYTIEARIPWSFLGVSGPVPGMVMPASFALHTVNNPRTLSAKLNWSFRSELDTIRLGELRLTE